MAVYTPVTLDDLAPLLASYDLGEAKALKGIDGGIENTNYFLTLSKEGQTYEYVLTLFEELSAEDVPFFTELGQWINDNGVAVPYGIKDRNGIALHTLHRKPTIIQPRFNGQHVEKSQLTIEHCHAVGAALAQYHLAGQEFFMQRQAHRGVFWWRRESARIAAHLETEDAQLLTAEVAAFEELRSNAADLPLGVLHGDLFHDNVLFNGQEIDAILDIYNAANGYLLYDLAIAVNDWCINEDGSVNSEYERALLTSYASVRPFTEGEHTAWPVLLRTAAMRFWLSRLLPWLGLEQDGSESGEKKLKDPNELKNILLLRQQSPGQLPR